MRLEADVADDTDGVAAAAALGTAALDAEARVAVPFCRL